MYIANQSQREWDQHQSHQMEQTEDTYVNRRTIPMQGVPWLGPSGEGESCPVQSPTLMDPRAQGGAMGMKGPAYGWPEGTNQWSKGGAKGPGMTGQMPTETIPDQQQYPTGWGMAVRATLGPNWAAPNMAQMDYPVKGGNKEGKGRMEIQRSQQAQEAVRGWQAPEPATVKGEKRAIWVPDCCLG